MKQYSVTSIGVDNTQAVVLMMNKDTARLVADALDVINPDDPAVFQQARHMAVDLYGETY